MAFRRLLSGDPQHWLGHGGYGLSETDIFISYCRDERSAARHFADCFAREGFKVWWDAVLRSGQTFDEVIERELRAAKAVVVLWSPRSVSSRWVRAEATLADRGNKLVPVIIEPCTLPIIFELTQAADLSKWDGDTGDANWQMLVSDLRRMTGDEIDAHHAPAPAISPEPVAPVPEVPANGEDELMRALERIARKRGLVPDLARPTPDEEEMTQFFREADARRLQEGDRFHILQRIDGDPAQSRYVVSPAGVKIGRSLPADIVVSGTAVSRSHCLVELGGDKLRITDLNSTNGTYIDDERVVGSALLDVGSVLRIGNVLFEHQVCPRSQAGDDAVMMHLADQMQPDVRRVAKSRSA